MSDELVRMVFALKPLADDTRFAHSFTGTRDRLVLAALAWLAGRDDTCSVSTLALGDMTGLAAAQVRGSVLRLIAGAYVVVVEERSGDTPPRYMLVRTALLARRVRGAVGGGHPIDELVPLGLSARSLNALLRAGVSSIELLAKEVTAYRKTLEGVFLPFHEHLRMDGIGVTSGELILECYDRWVERDASVAWGRATDG